MVNYKLLRLSLLMRAMAAIYFRTGISGYIAFV